MKLFGGNTSIHNLQMTVSLSMWLCQQPSPGSAFIQTLSSDNFNSIWVSVHCLLRGEAAGRARLLRVRNLRAVEQMHTINSGYFRLVAFWSSSSFFVTFSFGDQRCLVTRDRGEGWVSWEWRRGRAAWGSFWVVRPRIRNAESLPLSSHRLLSHSVSDLALKTQTSPTPNMHVGHTSCSKMHLCL